MLNHDILDYRTLRGIKINVAVNNKGVKSKDG